MSQLSSLRHRDFRLLWLDTLETLPAAARALRPLLPLLRYVAGLSYGLYLVHYPLLQASNRLASHAAPVLRIVVVAGP